MDTGKREKRLLVGLGNPGKKYEKTRHNFGQHVLFAFADKQLLVFKTQKHIDGEIAIGEWKNKIIILLFPKTYMNLSGKAVARTIDFYKVKLEESLILLDDADLPFGTIRLRRSGSAGGHNGLKSIEESLNTSAYQRLKLGVGRDEEGLLRDHVLRPFTNEEQEKIPEITTRAICAMEGWLSEEIKEYG